MSFSLGQTKIIGFILLQIIIENRYLKLGAEKYIFEHLNKDWSDSDFKSSTGLKESDQQINSDAAEILNFFFKHSCLKDF